MGEFKYLNCEFAFQMRFVNCGGTNYSEKILRFVESKTFNYSFNKLILPVGPNMFHNLI